ERHRHGQFADLQIAFPDRPGHRRGPRRGVEVLSTRPRTPCSRSYRPLPRVAPRRRTGHHDLHQGARPAGRQSGRSRLRPCKRPRTVMAVAPLPPEALYTRCEAGCLGFATTDDLADLHEVVGQDRALEAIRFGAAIAQEGYNLFVLGPPGTGRHTTVERILRAKAAGEPVPPDWVYLNNFVTPHQPTALALPPGEGR